MIIAPAFLALMGGLAPSDGLKSVTGRPNIVLIMADDLGYSDIGCYGGEISTPNLDRLARNGLRFRQFYNFARCCPTRASLMTGLYPHQTGIGHMTCPPEDIGRHDYNLPAYRGTMNHQCVTIAEVLKDSGYKTIMSGKWHLGQVDKEIWPLQRGFDRYFGIISGAANYFDPQPPNGLTLGNHHYSPGDNFYITDAFTDYAVKFLQEVPRKKGQPFFLYLSYTSPHWPLHAIKEDIDKYRNNYADGWTELREQRFKRMKNLGIIDDDVELSPRDSRDWDSLPLEKKQEMSLRMAIYAAQIDRMDQNIGRLISEIEKSGEMNNTLILFLSDNGACAEFSELGDGKREDLESGRGWVLSYGKAWANASNTPFRSYKHWVHEGGICTPFIVHWPEGMASRLKGGFTDQYSVVHDIMATLSEVADAKYPTIYKGNTIPPLEGKSFLHVIRGQDTPVHQEPVFWEHEGNCAVRQGKYKLVSRFRSGQASNWELYDLEADRSEMVNLADKMEDRVKKMSDLYDQWAVRCNVVSWDTITAIRKKK